MALMGSACIAGYAYYAGIRPSLLEVHIFSLKGGQVMFIRTPTDQRILVDGGGNAEIIRHLTSILPFYSRHIDAIIATNTDGKNVPGLIDVLERYDVGMVYVPGHTLQSLGLASTTDVAYETFLEAVERKDIEVRILKAGDQVSMDGIILNVLFPIAQNDIEKFSYSKASAPEILFQILFGDMSILSVGDASLKVQKYVASSSAEIVSNVDVLIVSQSASAANLSQEFIHVASPDYLVYSQAVAKSVPKKNKAKSSTSSKSTKKKADPLAAILSDHRYNLRERGDVKITSDGHSVVVTTK